MSPRVSVLTGEEVARLPGSCGDCLFWEMGGACPEPRTHAVPRGVPLAGLGRAEASVLKQEWLDQRRAEGVHPGCIIRVEGRIVAAALFAPADAFARRWLPVPPTSDDSLLLASAWVDPRHREMGYGRSMIHAALREAHRLDLQAVEAYGDRRYRDRSCSLPAMWLINEGFEVRTEHPRTPLLRLEGRRTARWAGSLEQAWEEVLGRLPRPHTVPVPGNAPLASQADPSPIKKPTMASTSAVEIFRW